MEAENLDPYGGTKLARALDQEIVYRLKSRDQANLAWSCGFVLLWVVYLGWAWKWPLLYLLVPVLLVAGFIGVHDSHRSSRMARIYRARAVRLKDRGHTEIRLLC